MNTLHPEGVAAKVIQTGRFHDKQEKNTARLMYAMVQSINRDYLSKVPTDRGQPPIAGCFTCHRGNPRPAIQEGR